jgi:hypothetical protein
MLKEFAIALCLGAPLLHAQHVHFPDQVWKERKSDHFTLRVSSTSNDPASRYAEKVWDVCVAVMPGMKQDFEKNEFRTPGGGEASDDAPFRFTIYLLGNARDYQELVKIDAERNGWDANYVRLIHQTGSYADVSHRYLVLCKGNVAESGGGGERDMTAVFVHSTGSTLMEGQARGRNLPFWMTAGFGYYVEHQLFSLCRVHYLDFEAYYNDNAEIKKGDSLGPDESWAKVLKKMCKKGERVSLANVCAAEILTLTPQQSGYLFALTSFLVRDEPARVKYRELLAKSAAGGSIDKALLLSTYGYANDAALEKEWYEWIESRDFK